MDPSMVGVIAIIVLFFLIAIRMPIAFAFGLTGALGFAYLVGIKPALSLLGTVPLEEVASVTLSSIPLFILMGHLASVSGIVTDLFHAVNKWFGRVPGGFGMASIVGCAGFGAVCGSSTGAAATMSAVAYPEMTKYGYKPEFSLGTIAAGGTLGIMIPPSIPFIIYGVLTEQSIGKLFVAGILPGILLTTLFVVTVYIIAKVRPELAPLTPLTSEKITWAEKFVSLKGAWGVIVLATIVLGGLYSGLFTPTETAAIGAGAAFILALVRRRLTWSNLARALQDTCMTSCMIFLIIVGAMFFNYFLAITLLPAKMNEFILQVGGSPHGVLLIILGVYFILGALMDVTAMILLTIPLFFPLITRLEFDPIWFGVVFVVCVEMAMITPPVGMNVFVLSGMVPDVGIYTIFRGAMPFVIAMFIGLATLIIVPDIALFLPRLMK